MKRKPLETGASDWMAPFKAPGVRVVINVGVMTPQQRAEVIAQGVPIGVTNMERFLEQGVQTSRTQAERASKPRGDVELANIVHSLARRVGTAKELWSALFGELDAAGCGPNEDASVDDMRKWRITYIDEKGRARTVSFGTFQHQLGESRKSE